MSESQRCVQILADTVNDFDFFLADLDVETVNDCFGFFGKLCWKCSDHRLTREKYAKFKKKKQQKEKKMTPRRRDGRTGGRCQEGKLHEMFFWILVLIHLKVKIWFETEEKLSRMSLNLVRPTEGQSFSPLIAP